MNSLDHYLRIRAWSDRANFCALLVLVAIIYYGAARLGLLLAFESTNVSPIWPPTGIAFAAVLLVGWRIWPAIALGAFVANFAVFSANHFEASITTALASSAIALGNTLEAIVGAYLLRAFIRAGNLFDQPSHVFKFSIAVMLMCIVSAVIGTQTLMMGQLAPAAARGNILLSWWLGDVGGALVVMPALLSWLTPQSHARPPRSRWEIIASLTGLLVIAAFIFSGRFFSLHTERLLLMLCFFCEAWAAYRFGRRGVTLTSLLLAATAVLATVNGVGPFTAGPLNDSLILLVSFIALSSVSGLVLAADIAERDGLQKDRATGWRELASSWLALLVALALTVLAWHLMSVDTEQRADNKFHRTVSETQLSILKRASDLEEILQGARGLFAASRLVERDEWKAYVEALRIRERFPGILGIGYAPKVEAGHSDAVISEARASGLPDFKIWPLSQREEAIVALYFEPFSGSSRRGFGFDMLSDPTRRAAILLARDSGDLVTTGKVMFMQNPDSSLSPVGSIMYLPIYRKGASYATVAERRAALVGYVFGVFRVDDFIQSAIGDTTSLLRVEIFDGTDTAAQALMYRSSPATEHERTSAFATTLSTDVGKHLWTLRFTALPAFEHSIDRQKAQLVLIAGAVISLLLFMLMRSLALTTERAIGLANEMSAALRHSRNELQNSDRRLSLATQAAGIGIWDWDIPTNTLNWDDQLYAMYKVAKASTRINYAMWRERLVPEDLERAERELRGVIESHGRFISEYRIVLPDGEIRTISAIGVVIRNEHGEPQNMVGVNWDITESRRAEQQLRVALAEKEILLKEVYHRVKNNLQVVISLFNLQINSLADGVARNALRESADRVRAMALVHEKLYTSSNLASLPIAEYVSGLCHQIEASHAISQRTVAIRCEIDSIELGMDMAVPLGLLLNELLSNCMKHAFPDGRSGQINVSVKRRDADCAELSVIDDGVGLPPGFDPQRTLSLGVKLSVALSKQLGGTITFENIERGTRVLVLFKLPETTAQASEYHSLG